MEEPSTSGFYSHNGHLMDMSSPEIHTIQQGTSENTVTPQFINDDDKTEIEKIHEEDVEFDAEYMCRVSHLPIGQLERELQLIIDGNHPLLSTVQRRIDKEKELCKDRIQCHRDRAELKALNDFNRKKAEADAEFDSKLAELQEEAQKRSEELDRAVLHEYGVIDITKPMAAPLVFESNKKTLRGRGGGQLIEPVTYFNSNPGNKMPEIKYNLAFDADRIREDLDYILQRSSDESRRKVVYQVSIQKPKLVIDNKNFKQGEDVYAQNSTFGEMLAKIDIVSDKLIHLKGAKGWDTRQISATLEDLQEGRVTIAKQRAKDRG